ncbi:MAG: SUMF1/EgtB/PvdO family nonheme iron enzyme [Candidatus Nealsonbacteria bacterium]|nr:SUMF1/EgtB/PvdO family nonheme iron enzyme [Candidatus Nealsonbacteria bacterium]
MLAVVLVVVALDSASMGDVFNMGEGFTSLEMVPVGNLGNDPDTRYATPGYGGVDYAYNIGKYEVTAGQYTEFLNAVAATDTNGLYSSSMWGNSYGCKIEQTGSNGSYTYSVAADRENRPVNFVSFMDSMRFTNWLENGQPTGMQNASTTEAGVYTIDNGLSEIRNSNATYFIPSEDEWYKAAYHKNDGATGNYWEYPAQSNIAPGYVNNSGNLSGTGTTFTEGGMDPGNYATYDKDGGTEGIGSPYWTTEVGEWENSESPYGTFDQGGNLWEWNETLTTSSLRGGRGGSYLNHIGDDLHAAFRPNSNQLSPGNVGNFSLGFRVASVPKPSTIVLDDVPEYEWRRGCSPTSATMLMGYWDQNGYPNLWTGTPPASNDPTIDSDPVNVVIEHMGDLMNTTPDGGTSP